jgi:hypothetical protein
MPKIEKQHWRGAEPLEKAMRRRDLIKAIGGAAAA